MKYGNPVEAEKRCSNCKNNTSMNKRVSSFESLCDRCKILWKHETEDNWEYSINNK